MQSITSIGSRRDRERLRRRTEILDAAKLVFADRGYSNATLSEIATTAELGKGTIYNYFPDGKEEILTAIFDQLYDGLQMIIKESFPQGGNHVFRDALRSFISRSFTFFSERINLFMILIKEAERLHLNESTSFNTSFFSSRHDEIIDALASSLGSAMERGDLRPMPPKTLAHLIFVNLKGFHLNICPHRIGSPVSNPEGDVSQSADELTEFILFGAASPGTPRNQYAKVGEQQDLRTRDTTSRS